MLLINQWCNGCIFASTVAKCQVFLDSSVANTTFDSQRSQTLYCKIDTFSLPFLFLGFSTELVFVPKILHMHGVH